MKKVFTAALIFISGAGLLGSLHVESKRLGQELNTALETSRVQAAEIESAKKERETLRQQAQDLRDNLQAIRAATGSEVELLNSTATLALANQLLSPEQSERLLAELGFAWNTTGKYLIVSKETLHRVSMNGMKGPKLTDALCGVLAVSPAERSTLETTAQSLFENYATWMKEHVQRSEPKGNMICEYKVALDEAFSQTSSNAFTTQVLSTLGTERGGLMLNYDNEWMRSMGMLGSEPTTLTVTQYKKDEARYQFTIKSTYSSMTTDISPWQPFPEAFKPLFPGGWADLAKAEGFQLPKEFEKHKAR